MFRCCAIAPIALLAILAVGGPGTAGAEGAGAAETLVRAVYYEGLPPDAARALDDAGVARLGEMLRDASEAAHHANIVSALGLSAHPAAFGILRAYAENAPRGEVARDAFRARSRLPQSLGHLARSDHRALAWLVAAEAKGGALPAWSFRQHRGEHLRALLDEQTLTGLALSGAPEAQAVIDAALATPDSGAAAERRRRHARFAKELCERVAREGAADGWTQPGGADAR